MTYKMIAVYEAFTDKIRECSLDSFVNLLSTYVIYYVYLHALKFIRGRCIPGFTASTTKNSSPRPLSLKSYLKRLSMNVIKHCPDSNSSRSFCYFRLRTSRYDGASHCSVCLSNPEELVLTTDATGICTKHFPKVPPAKLPRCNDRVERPYATRCRTRTQNDILTHSHTHTHAHSHTHTCTHSRHIHTSKRTRTYIHTFTHTHMHTQTNTYAQANEHTKAYTHLYTHTYTHPHILTHTHAYIFPYIHT